MSAEVVTRRQVALDAIVTRVKNVCGSYLSTAECLQISIASNVRNPEDLLHVVINDTSAKRAFANVNQLAITPEEWRSLFGKDSIHTNNALIEKLHQMKPFQAAVVAMERAMKTTLNEREQAEIYKKPITKAALYVALHHREEATAMEAIVDCIVRADMRRINDIVDAIEDFGIDSMLVANAIVAIAESVVS